MPEGRYTKGSLAKGLSMELGRFSLQTEAVIKGTLKKAEWKEKGLTSEQMGGSTKGSEK